MSTKRKTGRKSSSTGRSEASTPRANSEPPQTELQKIVRQNGLLKFHLAPKKPGPVFTGPGSWLECIAVFTVMLADILQAFRLEELVTLDG